MTELLEKLHQLEVEITRLQEQKRAADSALVLATAALDHYKHLNNEWRTTLSEWRASCPTKDEIEATFRTQASERNALEARVKILERESFQASGKSEAFGAIWVKVTVVLGLLIGLATLILHFWK